MRKLIRILLAVLISLSLFGCDREEKPDPENKGMNIMFVVTGSLGGGNNVDDVKAALDAFVADKGGTVNTTECKMDASIYQTTLETAAESKKYDLIVTGFGSMVEPLCNTAEQYPDQKFLLFDAAIDFEQRNVPNCISVQALGNQGGFLAGALSALMTQSPDAQRANAEKVVGFIGATESTPILDFFVGFVDGVKYVDESVNIIYSFVGSQTDSALTQELAIAQNQLGADVIFAATNSDLAVADVALDKGLYAICCDTDEAAKIASTNKDLANHILTSVIKDYNGMVTPVLYKIADGTVEWGTHSYITFGQGGVKLADNEFFKAQVPDSVLAQYNEIVKKVANNEIKIDSAYGASNEDINAKKALCTAK